MPARSRLPRPPCLTAAKRTVDARWRAESMDETLAQLRELLARAIRLDGAQLGNIQLYDPSTKTLRIVVHEGFDQRFLSHFAVVNAFDSSACGRAAGVRSPIVIADVASDPAF